MLSKAFKSLRYNYALNSIQNRSKPCPVLT